MKSTQLTLNNKIEQFLNGETVQLSEAELSSLYANAERNSNPKESVKTHSVVEASSKFVKPNIPIECNEILDIPCYVTMPIH